MNGYQAETFELKGKYLIVPYACMWVIGFSSHKLCLYQGECANEALFARSESVLQVLKIEFESQMR